MNIIIVDDDDLHVEMISMMITGYDPLIKIKCDLAGIEEFQPDLIILDLYMPGKSGIDIARELKDNPATSNIPKIMLSGSSEIMDKMDAYDCGCIEFIEKPISRELLIGKIKKYSSIGKIYKSANRILND